MNAQNPLFRTTSALVTAALAVSTLTAAAHQSTPAAHDIRQAALPAIARSKPTVKVVIELTATETDTSSAATIDDSASTLGVADSNIYQLSEAGVVENLDELQSIGVTSIRIPVPWMSIEPTEGTYNWTQMDYIVQQATARGISIVATVTENPSWDGTVDFGAPNAAAYASFAATVASRYSTDVSAIEIMNEENSQAFNLGGSAATYTAVLKATYTAIKAVDPNMTVILGGLASVATSSIGTSPETFLSQMLADGAAGFFDAIAYHPYSTDTQLSQGTAAQSPINQLTALRADLNAYGLSGVQIWATEYGEATTPGTASTAQQAAYIENFVVEWNALATTLNLGPAYLYTTRDIDSGALNDEDNYGLFYTDGTPKPAALVVQQLEYDLANGIALPSLASTIYTMSPGEQVSFTITEALEILQLPINLVTGVAQYALTSLASAVASLPPVKAALAALASVASVPIVKTALAAVSAALSNLNSMKNTVTGAVTAAAVSTVVNSVNALAGTGKTVSAAVSAVGAALAAVFNPPAKTAQSSTAVSISAATPAAASTTTSATSTATSAAATVTASTAATSVAAAKAHVAKASSSAQQAGDSDDSSASGKPKHGVPKHAAGGTSASTSSATGNTHSHGTHHAASEHRPAK